MCATDSFRRPGSGHGQSAAGAPFQRLGISAREPGQQLQEQSKSLLLNRPKSSPAVRHLEAAAVSFERRKWLDPVRESLAAGDNKTALRCLLEPLAGKTNFPRWFLSMVDENLDALKRQFLSELPPPSINRKEVRQYPRSMLVLQGENSPHAFQMVTAAFRRCARNAQLETIKRCGHIFQVDAPGKVLERITKFFNDQVQ
jgi:pimeloyl-ACP methyl ester carboxylesterase